MIYTTNSIHDSAYLLIAIPGRFRGVVSDGQRCVMQFENINGDCEAAVREFHSGVTANVREFARATGFVRDRIFEVTNQRRKESQRNLRNTSTKPSLQPQAV